MHEVTLRGDVLGKYIYSIDNGASYEKLDRILERASKDKKLTQEEYAFLYGYALQKENWI